MLQILYLVHDLSDPAVRRRVLMLEAGGAKVTLAGFRRADLALEPVEGRRLVDLGPTYSGNFSQRIAAVLGATTRVGDWLGTIPRPDVILARNLEMLAVARRARAKLAGHSVPVVYECLDIHRLLLRRDLVGGTLRMVEKMLARDIVLLVTSSPAFLRNYFDRFGQISAPVELVENKLIEISSNATPAPLRQRRGGAPWRIGWFGALRCRRSLALLADLTRRLEGRVEVVMRGRPALNELPDFHAFVAAEPFMSFEGPYRNPEDIQSIYDDVHFSWVIDFFEEGQNSSWLLPNRLYEGCRFGAVPIAMRRTEVGRFLAERGLGVLLDTTEPAILEAIFASMSPQAYHDHQARVEECDAATWICDERACRALVDTLGRTTARERDRPLAHAA